MARLPTQLKKRLQANLENLTAREAGRLLLIYDQEADKKKTKGDGAQPMAELWAAMDSRVAKSRGKPEERGAVNTYNGLLFLQAILRAVNAGDFLRLLTSFAFDSYRVMVGVGLILQEDSTTQLIRFFKGRITDETPKPLSRDDYRRLLEWANDGAVETLSSAAQTIYQAGDEASNEEAIGKIYDALLAKYQAGELVGGEAVYHVELESPVMIVAGKLPAWAVLRLLWKPFLYGTGHKVIDNATLADWSPDMIDQVFAPTGELLDWEALRKLAGDFYKACRRRPWGKGLVAKPDLDDLVKLLTQSANPLLHVNPVDFGHIDWEAFRKNERNWAYRQLEEGEEVFESEPAATVASLNAVAQEFGETVSFGNSWLENLYYPAKSPEYRREELARLFGMMAGLETSRQPFTYGWHAKEEGERSLSELLGVDFLTPLERMVENLRIMNSTAVSIRQALRIISDRYFGGLPILRPSQEVQLLEGEGHLKTASEGLTSWLDRLSAWPWEIDTSSLRIDDPDADDDEVEEIIDTIISEAKRDSRIDKPDALLGEG